MTTHNLSLPEWEQNQDQPHVTVNTALRILDCLTQLAVQDRDLNEPPSGSSSAIDGECYIVNGAGTGDWDDAADGAVAMFIGGAWSFRTPQIGWRAYVIDEDADIRFYGGSVGWDVVS